MSGKSGMNDFHISKTLSWLLRHGAVKEKLPINSEGFINVNALLNHRSLAGKCTVDDIKRIVASNDKQRFALRATGNVLEIRANQGHSVNVVGSLDLKPITDPKQFLNIIHGTYYRFWDSIKANGLNRMNRNHIHFASGLPSDRQVISGMRKTCDIYIYLNPQSVLSAGIELFLSTNGVILSPGNEKGIIEPKHFLKVIDTKTGIAPNASKSEICDFFSQFGKISEFYSDVGNSFVTIQFEKQEVAAAVLKKRLYFLGRYLLIKPRKLKKLETRSPETQRAEDYGKITEYIKQYPDFDYQLNQFIRALQVHENFLQPPDYVKVCGELEYCLQSKFPNCRVRPFGSTVSGLGFKNSDMDIYVEVLNHLDISSSSDDSPAAIYTKIAKKVLSDTKLFSNVIAIPKAKTPIVKLIHKATGINCDINFKNMLGVCNSILIKFLLSLDYRLRPLLFIIKFWAKVNEISGTGKIANYGIIMLAIFYLQQEPFLLLPPIEILQTPGSEVFVDGWNGGFHTNRNFIPAYYFKNSVHVTKILEGFFNFYAKFDYGFNVICPLNAKILQKSDFASPEKLPVSFLLYKNNLSNGEPLKTFSPLCLQDPFELNHNITGNVSSIQLEEFQKLCQIAANICNDCIVSNNLQNLLPKLFVKHQLEVFVVTDEKCVFKIPGTVINIDATTNSENSQQIWFDKLIEFLTSALSKIFLFKVTVSKDEHHSKSQKMNEQTDIHDDSIQDSFTFHCVGHSNIWEARKSIAKTLGSTINKDSFFDQETAISEYIANVLCSGIKVKDAIVDFKLVIYFKVKPTEAEFILTDINSRKHNFKIIANFFVRKIPDWFDRYLKELRNVNNSKENEPKEIIIIND